MTSTLRIDCQQADIDADNNETNSKEYTVSVDFTVSRVKTFSLATGAIWRDISFEDLASISFLRIISDQEIEVRINGTTTAMTELKNLIFQGLCTQIQIRNNSGATAEITVEMYE
jgi:hypothetical protein